MATIMGVLRKASRRNMFGLVREGVGFLGVGGWRRFQTEAGGEPGQAAQHESAGCVSEVEEWESWSWQRSTRCRGGLVRTACSSGHGWIEEMKSEVTGWMSRPGRKSRAREAAHRQGAEQHLDLTFHHHGLVS